MFDIGDYIVYGHNGICKVEDITHPDLAGADEKKLYYVLIPEKTKDSRLFCPAENDRVTLRKIVNAKEAKDIIKESETIEPLVITNEKLRDDSYKTVMKGCDLREWVQLIKTLLNRKQERENSGKKITATDERYLKLASDGLLAELSIAMDVSKDEVKEMLAFAI